DEQGATVEGDQVPVTVVGDAYEFEGKGLIIRWHDRDQRLERLEVAHGGRLLLKDLSKLTDSAPKDAPTPASPPKAPPAPPPTAEEAAAASETAAVQPPARPPVPVASTQAQPQQQ